MHSGGFAAEGNTTNGATYAKKTVTAARDGYARVYFNLKSAASQVNLLRMRAAGSVSLGYAFVTATGQLGLRNDVTATTTMSSTVVGPGWHALELHMLVNGTASMSEVWLDGTRVADISSALTNLGTSPITRVPDRRGADGTHLRRRVRRRRVRHPTHRALAYARLRGQRMKRVALAAVALALLLGCLPAASVAKPPELRGLVVPLQRARAARRRAHQSRLPEALRRRRRQGRRLLRKHERVSLRSERAAWEKQIKEIARNQRTPCQKAIRTFRSATRKAAIANLRYLDTHRHAALTRSAATSTASPSRPSSR